MPSIPPLFSIFQAKVVLARRGAADPISTSLDLNRSEAIGRWEGDLFLIGECRLTLKHLQKIVKEDRKVYRLDTVPPEAVKVFSPETGWLRSLCPTRLAPTVLVSGIPMHRIKNTDPMADTATKIAALGSVKGRILDTATGLGYTAITASGFASEVVTVEIDPGALAIARLNPWSRELFEASNIQQELGDVFELIKSMPSGSFAGILHDPPTVALGGDLYGEAFYRELRRVLRPGGRLFHYLGDLEGGIGGKMLPGVIRRLSEAGFGKIERHPEAYGVSAIAK